MHRDDLLSNTTDINTHIDFLNKEKLEKNYKFDRFLIDKEEIRKVTYSSKGRYSRAILSLYSSKKPKDWKYTDRDVISDNFSFQPTNQIYITSFQRIILTTIGKITN